MANVGRELGHLTAGQWRLFRNLLEPERAAWLRAQPLEAPGLRGRMSECSFCNADWSHHFNQSGQQGQGAAGNHFRQIQAGDTVGVECAALIARLGQSITKTLRAAKKDQSWGLPRAPEGWQISIGWERGPHRDDAHLGHMILTLTVDGDCIIGVQRVRGEAGSKWHKFAQAPGDFYAIWGPSVRPSTVKHKVEAGANLRLSITMRFVRGVPAARLQVRGRTEKWQVGDQVRALWLGKQWFGGCIEAIASDGLTCDIRYSDNELERGVRFRVGGEAWVVPAVTLEDEQCVRSRDNRRERAVRLGKRKRI